MPVKSKAYKVGFTLLEVQLSVFIMATSILSICALYSLGFRESRQSVEDVAGAALAEAYLSPLIHGLSATNMLWSQWKQIGSRPSSGAALNHNVAYSISPQKGEYDGWRVYVDILTPEQDDPDKTFRYRVNKDWQTHADGAWGEVNGRVPREYRGTKPRSGDFKYAFVVTRRGSIIQLAFRCARRRETLMTVPAYVTEVRFNGDPEN